MVDGHEAFTETVGTAPEGFRTPHFSDFVAREQLQLVSTTSAQLGYRYSSSSGPAQFFAKGPYFFPSSSGVAEVPLTGCPTWPSGILDSYSFVSPDSSLGPEAYISELSKLPALLERWQPLVVNIYADPSHVIALPGFVDALAPLARWCRPSIANLIEG